MNAKFEALLKLGRLSTSAQETSMTMVRRRKRREASRMFPRRRDYGNHSGIASSECPMADRLSYDLNHNEGSSPDMDFIL
jgi:hypothetical protein